MREREYYENWLKRGFTNLEITPFGLPLEKVIHIVSQRILEHYREGKLYSGDIPLKLDEAEPLGVWPRLIQADVKGELKYFVSKFERNQGFTKKQFLDLPDVSFPGYLVYLREQNLKIPRQGQGKTIGERKQMETNQTAQEYLHLFLGEKTRGLTPEDYLTFFLTHLEETNQVTDDLDEGGACFCVGAFHEPTGFVPDSYWGREYLQLTLGVGPSDKTAPNVGARPVVEIGNRKLLYSR